MSAILLFSGGKESVYQLHKLQDEVTLLLLADYGNKSFPKEKESLLYYSKKFNIPYKIIDLKGIMEVPNSIKNGADCNPYVPTRNLIFTSIAMNIAESLNYDKIYIGLIKNGLDFDGNKNFKDVMNYVQSWYEGKAKINSVSVRLTTIGVVKKLIEDAMDITHLWSCDNEEKKLCGKCSKCINTLSDLSIQKDKPFIKEYVKTMYASDAVEIFLQSKNYADGYYSKKETTDQDSCGTK